MELAWTHTEKKRRLHCQTSTTVDTTWPQKYRATKEHLEMDLEQQVAGTGWRKMEAAVYSRAGWRSVVV